jgi:hypothetical protein
MTAKPYQHPRLTKAKAGFATYADHMRVVEAREAADARRAAREKELQEEDEYMQKRNERLRVMVVLEGRERLKQNMQYSPYRDPVFNGQGMPWSCLRYRPHQGHFINMMHGSQTFSGHLVQHYPPSVAGSRQ